tara:strand:+ start:54 stop:284 length:231 start_codon:yes stop_codon:yes gene_type:complete
MYKIINGKVEWVKANQDDKEMAQTLAIAIRKLGFSVGITHARVNYERQEIEGSFTGEDWFSLSEMLNLSTSFLNSN